jgi:transposase
MIIILDGATYYRSQLVKDEAQVLNINLQRLPTYSPDFIPVEHLWQCFQEDLTYHICYHNKTDLIKQVQLFQHRLNQTLLDIADRLWISSHLKH